MNDHEKQYRLEGELVPESGMKEWHNSRGIPWGKTFDGPEPKTISRMRHPGRMNLAVHLSNEHGREPDYIDVRRTGREISHALFHQYGVFRPGQGHYHSQPEA